MRRFCSIIAIVTFTICTYGQSLKTIKERVQRLIANNEFKGDTTGLHRLPKFTLSCKIDDKNNWNNFLPIDLNNDGLLDLLFSGPCDPYDHTSIYINERNQLILIHESAGKVNSIEKSIDKTIINIRKEPCCCDSEYSNTEVTIDKNLGTLWNTITYVKNTKMDDKPIELIVSGVLRSSPVANDVEMKNECNQLLKGNHLINISKPSRVIQLTRLGQWRLVLYPVTKTSSTIGWLQE